MFDIPINIYFALPYYAALCLMFSITHYAQHYAGIIGGSLAKTGPTKISQAGLIFAENFAKIGSPNHFCCKNRSSQSKLGSQNFFSFTNFDPPVNYKFATI